MAKSQVTIIKQEKEKKRLKKRLDKQQKKEERKANAQSGGLDSMIAYVDEFGNITDTPPDPGAKTKIDVETIEVSIRKKEKDDTPSVFTGKVEFFDERKGFGFIKESLKQEKYFVHANGCLETIKEGDLVSFEMERSFKGMNCIQVKKVKNTPPAPAQE